MKMFFYPITRELLISKKIHNSDFLKGLCESVIAIYPNGSPVLPWASYLVEHQEVLVGTCAFKSEPTKGEVEIAYFTFPNHEGKGVATSMAEELLTLARKSGATLIKARTLPEKNASTRILEKLGFIFVGTVVHPDDGEVWEWHNKHQ